MNKICNLEKLYLLKVNPINFVNSLECSYIFDQWIQSDSLLWLDKTSQPFNNISIIGIYNIVSNLISIFYPYLLNDKHKKEFTNIREPFILSNTFSISIICDTFSENGSSNNTFIYYFNGGFIKIKDIINTENLSVYEHNIFIPNTSSNDFLKNCLFLYESFIDNLADKVEYF